MFYPLFTLYTHLFYTLVFMYMHHTLNNTSKHPIYTTA
jgi:hypothetical protein